jgi:hypothetical protein
VLGSCSIAPADPLRLEFTVFDRFTADFSAEQRRIRGERCTAARVGARRRAALGNSTRPGREKNEIHRMGRRASIVVRRAVTRSLETLDLVAIDPTCDLAREREPVIPIREVQRRIVGSERAAATESTHVRPSERLAAPRSHWIAGNGVVVGDRRLSQRRT